MNQIITTFAHGLDISVEDWAAIERNLQIKVDECYTIIFGLTLFAIVEFILIVVLAVILLTRKKSSAEKSSKTH